MALKDTIERLASEFARDLLHALKDVSFEDFVQAVHGGPAPRAQQSSQAPRAPRGNGGKRGRVRRSDADLSSALDRIVDVLKSAGDAGLRSEELRKKVGIPRDKMQRPIELGLGNGRLRKTGARRATTYFAR